MISHTPYPNRLAECMLAAGMTDPRLANLAGTTKQQIFKLRRGERNLTVQWAQRLAPHLHVEWYELVDGAKSPPTDQVRTDLFAVYETMTGEQRRALLTVAKAMVPAAPPAAATPDPPTKPQPAPRRPAALLRPVPCKRARS